MDDHPLPNLDSDNSDSDIEDEGGLRDLVHWALRITPHDKFTYEEFKAYLHDYSQVARYVLSRELVPREHFHAVLSIDKSVPEIEARDIPKHFLNKYWAVLGKLPRGFGNKQYNLQQVKDLDKAISYVLKQHDYVYEIWDPDYIKEREAESFEKKAPCDFKNEYRSLCETWQSGTSSVADFMIDFCLLKAKYDQQVNMSHAYGYALSNLFKREPEEARRYVSNYLNKY